MFHSSLTLAMLPGNHPMLVQKVWMNEHSEKMWSADSTAALQTSQVASSRMFLRARASRQWILIFLLSIPCPLILLSATRPQSFLLFIDPLHSFPEITVFTFPSNSVTEPQPWHKTTIIRPHVCHYLIIQSDSKFHRGVLTIITPLAVIIQICYFLLMTCCQAHHFLCSLSHQDQG